VQHDGTIHDGTIHDGTIHDGTIHDVTIHDVAVRAAWREYGDPRQVVGITELSAHVSTNHVYRVELDDGLAVIAKFSSYGSYFLFYEDHDRLHRCNLALRGGRYEHLMADTLTKDGKPFTYYDGETWAIFYEEVSGRGTLPRILTPDHIENFAAEMAGFHEACTDVADQIPPTSISMKSDIVNLLDQVTDPRRSYDRVLDSAGRDTVRRHAHEFLMQLLELGYDEFPRIPVLIDWNLGNFSVTTRRTDSGGERFELFSRWDYDWFRIDTRMLDFYFLSRVSSQTGDRTVFTYSSHTLIEDRFRSFLKAYHRVFPLGRSEILFLKEAYRFFILHYVVGSGERFFQHDLWSRLVGEAVNVYLPALDTLDLSSLANDVLG
jgi:hypothetical protein